MTLAARPRPRSTWQEQQPHDEQHVEQHRHAQRELVERERFETAEELLLALERGASRPVNAPAATPLIRRDPLALYKLALGVSVLFNVLLIVWLLFLPR
jgi:hypothetical protein